MVAAVSLRSVARALSFLTVGTVLLLAAFVQRVTERLDSPNAA